jgi:hypothetical protein
MLYLSSGAPKKEAHGVWPPGLLDALVHFDSLDSQDKVIDLLTELYHLGIDKAASLFNQQIQLDLHSLQATFQFHFFHRT